MEGASTDPKSATTLSETKPQQFKPASMTVCLLKNILWIKHNVSNFGVINLPTVHRGQYSFGGFPSPATAQLLLDFICIIAKDLIQIIVSPPHLHACAV